MQVNIMIDFDQELKTFKIGGNHILDLLIIPSDTNYGIVQVLYMEGVRSLWQRKVSHLNKDIKGDIKHMSLETISKLTGVSLKDALDLKHYNE